MRIVIDLQGAQAANQHRGIGRYSLALALAIGRNQGPHEVLIALNGGFSESIAPIREAFAGVLSLHQIRVWYPTGTAQQMQGDSGWTRQSSELLREAFLSSLQPDVVLVASLFEGCTDGAVVSVAKPSLQWLTVVVLYDLIPLIHRNTYLRDPVVAKWYEHQLTYLHRADLLLAISESTRQEGISHLGVDPGHIVNISSAVDARFRPLTPSEECEISVRARLGLNRPFVMYTGGIDPRKNIEGLIHAYSELPTGIRQAHQLAIVCKVHDSDRQRLIALAAQCHLKPDELVLTGFVSDDELVVLYNLCQLFVFPSWHEGFGLPALEAMACGSPVIGSNCSSVPEVIGRDDALFDPHDQAAMTQKIALALTDGDYRESLRKCGIAQAARFDWGLTAQAAIGAMQDLVPQRSAIARASARPERLRLAYVSPLPPARSGIADYSAVLLTELAEHYDVEVITAQEPLAVTWDGTHIPQRSATWFRAHADRYERVLYHFGNSPMHQHMFSLLAEIPGVVVLHDFFLANLIAHMEQSGQHPGFWSQALYNSHGYPALKERFATPAGEDATWTYPCNLDVLQQAVGVIVHSDVSLRLARQWYGTKAGADWAVVPLLRQAASNDTQERLQARGKLALSLEQFVVCSFGMLGPTKLNDRLLSAWLNSILATDPRCMLVFVGENSPGKYGEALLATIAERGMQQRVRISGWADHEQFEAYLHAADIGVQLRTLSRGETSAAALDCMIHGLPTIVNANGSMADLDGTAVHKIPDQFTEGDLVQALESLFLSQDCRKKLGENARAVVHELHSPKTCAKEYARNIEYFYSSGQAAIPQAIKDIALLEFSPSSAELKRAAVAMDRTIQLPLNQRQILVDISELVQRDARTGIQRVVRAILHEWLCSPPVGFRVEPVFANEVTPGYRYARKFSLDFLGCPPLDFEDAPISFSTGDVFVGLDLQHGVVRAQKDFYRGLRDAGVVVKFVIYDLLPINFPNYFNDGAAMLHHDWLQVVAKTDGAVCISRSVANEYRAWLTKHSLNSPNHDVQWFHLGADIQNSAPTRGLSAESDSVIVALAARKTFLMVGTLEPRKGHTQAIDALEALWEHDVNVNLVIVGKRGWAVKDLIARILHHGELNKRLFWLEHCTDEYLEKIYSASTCLIAASYGEGFGLPLIEAAQHKLPVIARDIPVFREVADVHAYYFDAEAPGALESAISSWLQLHSTGQIPQSHGMPWFTWRQSANQLMSLTAGSEKLQCGDRAPFSNAAVV